jgi:hypothetical protein
MKKHPVDVSIATKGSGELSTKTSSGCFDSEAENAKALKGRYIIGRGVSPCINETQHDR